MDKKIKILLVEDDVNLRETYSEILKLHNFDVVEANDGIEGLDLATKEIPDVIFTGIIMPRMDGFSMMEELKKNVATANIPVIMSSHMGREEDRQKAEALGAKDFILRNMTTPNEIVRRIQAIFESSGIYRVMIDPYSLDAQRLAKEIKLNPGSKCPSCGERIALELKPADQKEKTYQARFICPSCGWSPK